MKNLTIKERLDIIQGLAEINIDCLPNLMDVTHHIKTIKEQLPLADVSGNTTLFPSKTDVINYIENVLGWKHEGLSETNDMIRLSDWLREKSCMALPADEIKELCDLIVNNKLQWNDVLVTRRIESLAFYISHNSLIKLAGNDR